MCPEGPAVERRIDELLRGASASRAGWQAEARVEPHPEGFRMAMVLRDDARGLVERRALAAADCAALAQAFALIVAVHVDALHAEHNAVALEQPQRVPLPEVAVPSAPSGSWPAVEPVGPARSVTPPAVPTTRSPSARASSRPVVSTPRVLGGLLRLEGGAEVGIVPGVGGGAGVMGGVVGRAWRVELGAGAWPARSASVAARSVRLDAIVGRARVCWAPAMGRWHVPVCGGGEAGGLRGVGTTGVAVPRTEWAPWGAVTASAGATWSLRPWIGPYAAVEAVGALSRPSFRVADRTVVGTQAVGVRAWVGVELKFASRTRRPGKTQPGSPVP